LIRTIKDGFVGEASRAGFTSLEELNEAFQGWIESEYHARVHSEIKQTPLERWQKDESVILAVTPEHIRRALMMRAQRKVQEQTGTIYLDGLEYECSKDVAGQTVEVRWNVDQTESVEVWAGGQFKELAWLSKRPTSVSSVSPMEEEAYPTVASAKTRMAQLRAVTRSESIRRSDEFLSSDEFSQLVARYLERGLQPLELEKLSQFFRKFAPLKRSDVEKGLKKTVSVKGTSLHLRYYLQHLEQVAYAGRK
jgi:hypothetical protein